MPTLPLCLDQNTAVSYMHVLVESNFNFSDKIKEFQKYLLSVRYRAKYCFNNLYLTQWDGVVGIIVITQKKLGQRKL